MVNLMTSTLMLEERYLLNHQHLLIWNKCKKLFKIYNLLYLKSSIFLGLLNVTLITTGLNRYALSKCIKTTKQNCQ